MSRLIFVARPYLELIALGAFERHARSPAVTRGTQSKSDAVLRRSLARDNHSLAIAQHQRMSSGEWGNADQSAAEEQRVRTR